MHDAADRSGSGEPVQSHQNVLRRSMFGFRVVRKRCGIDREESRPLGFITVSTTCYESCTLLLKRLTAARFAQILHPEQSHLTAQFIVSFGSKGNGTIFRHSSIKSQEIL
eukprot:2714472-Amphidinium_carterae.1